MDDQFDIPMTPTQRLTLMQAQLKLLAHDCAELASCLLPQSHVLVRGPAETLTRMGLQLDRLAELCDELAPLAPE